MIRKTLRDRQDRLGDILGEQSENQFGGFMFEPDRARKIDSSTSNPSGVATGELFLTVG